MRHVVTLAGKQRLVTLPDVVPDGVAFTVQVDGKSYDATWLRREGTLLLRDPHDVERLFRVRGHQLTRPGDGTTEVRAEIQSGAATRPLTATVGFDLPGQMAQKAVSREQVVKSQITGKVLKVLVKVGDAVEPGTALVTIEAMKMENRVFASTSGKVHAVAVKDGDAVQTGKELLRIGP